MEKLKCQAYGIDEPIVVKVTSEHKRRSERLNYAFLTRGSISAKCKKYAAVLVPKGNDKTNCEKLPLVEYETSTYELTDNDIIQVLPDENELAVLYESEAKFNCLFLTERCNSKCIMCPQRPKPDSQDHFALNQRIIELVDPAPEYLTITGGEPTLLREKLINLVEECRNKLPETKLMILTNARKLKDISYAERLARLATGHIGFAVPIYADNYKQHDKIVAVEGAFHETIDGCQNLALYGLPIEIRVVVMLQNYERLPKIADFIYRNLPFTFHVALMGLEIEGLAKDNLDEVWIDPYDYREELLRACVCLFRRGINVSIYNHPLCLVPRQLWPICSKSISRWKNIYMSECAECTKKDDCGGFFKSAVHKYSSHVTPL